MGALNTESFSRGSNLPPLSLGRRANARLTAGILLFRLSSNGRENGVSGHDFDKVTFGRPLCHLLPRSLLPDKRVQALLRQRKAWVTKFDQRSPRYTTRLHDVPVVGSRAH
ncbi:DUF4113 domain-containing protein [Bosea sp. RAF48]|uniref:DUF4113 domain-containing protein n=1 Tax=Bosea sp. RAF48 TaxID=3237480 RepID=UPI003F8FF8D0